MSQKAFSTKNDDTFTEQQTRRWRRNEAGRRRYGRQTQERPLTFQLNNCNKMLKSRGLKSSRALQSDGAGSSQSGSQRNCAALGNKTGENGGQSSAVRDILLYIQKIIIGASCIFI